MPRADVVIFHQPPRGGDPPLVRLLADARGQLIEHQAGLFRRAGAAAVDVVPGREDGIERGSAVDTFGERLAILASEHAGRGLVVMGSGAVPRLSLADARRLVEVAASGDRRALTNNRYSSDVCAIGDSAALRDVPPLPSDNALPRWLEERAGFDVQELPGRDRLALDLDTPLDVALLGLASRLPAKVAALVRHADVHVPRLDEIRAVARDPHRELLVFGRSGSTTLAWLERNVRSRVRFLAEERGLRASSPLAIGTDGHRSPSRPPRASLGRLLADRGAGALASVVSELCDGAIIDSRVLMADRFGADEASWPSSTDRFASDLLRPTASAMRGCTSSPSRPRLPACPSCWVRTRWSVPACGWCWRVRGQAETAIDARGGSRAGDARHAN